MNRPSDHRDQSPPRAALRRPGYRRAFTLIEVLVTITVLAVLGSVASMTMRTSLDSYVAAATQAQLHAELSIAMDRILRELHNTQLKGGASVAPNISSVTASSIAWDNNYSLTLSGGRIMFVENGSAAAIMLDNVTAFTVQTYNESNTALAATLSGAACDPIRRVQIQITLSRAGVTETLRSKLFLRCTMEGA